MPDTTPTPAVWSDTDPLMTPMAAAVYEQCDRHPEVAVTIDDPRTIAAVAATVARQVIGAPTVVHTAPSYEVERLQGEVLALRAERAELQDLLRTENARANAAIERESVAEQAELEARADRATVLRDAADAAWQMGGRFGTDDHGDIDEGWNDACKAISIELRRLADEAQPTETARCTCADAGPEFAPAGHYADCPASTAATEEPQP